MPRYKRPTKAAIVAAARDYHENGPPAEQHSSMSYGVMPYLADFNRAFEAYCPDGTFSFGNDPFIGNDALNAAELWRELNTQLATFEAGEHSDECPGDGECNGGDECPSAQAGSWLSSVLGILGFEWL